ncbi:MAG: hypothetical protein IKY15_01810 [Clostridia bacterium]|nr:hypothetical protein [Clostridia bacterium]
MDKYIGIIYWNDNVNVLDNTTVSNLKSVWHQCCLAHPIHSGSIGICEAKFNEDGDVIGERLYSFVDVEECKQKYHEKYDK